TPMPHIRIETLENIPPCNSHVYSQFNRKNAPFLNQPQKCSQCSHFFIGYIGVPHTTAAKRLPRPGNRRHGLPAPASCARVGVFGLRFTQERRRVGHWPMRTYL